MLKRRRTGQLAVGIFGILALFVSSVSACACTHHGSAPKAKASCHGPAHHESVDTTQNLSSSSSLHESCTCVRPSNERPVKSETFKFKKLAAAISQAERPATGVTVEAVPQPTPFGRVPLFDERAYPPSLSRGPPVV